MAEAIFWITSLLVLYTYLGYVGIVALLAHLRSRPVAREPIRPTVSLLIVAHNEAQAIGQRLQNCLCLDYPQEKLEIVVASDGSTDGTVAIARGYEAQGVTVIGFEERRGKPSVLSEVIPMCRGEIVTLGDVRQTYDPKALVALVENFSDPTVGAVSGELHLINESGMPAGEGVGFYWRYEKFIRRCESRFDSTVGATGAIYAIRRRLFEPIPADTLLDDVSIPLRIVRQGYRVVFEPEARAFDRAAQTFREEFRRKVRTIAGNLQLFAQERWLWNASTNRLWFQAISHKLLRLLAPLLLGGALVTSAHLASSSLVYRLAFVGQLLFYGAAVAGCFLGSRPRIGRWLSIPYMFCLLNLTTVVSIFRFLTGAQAVTWQKTLTPASIGTSVGRADPTSEE